MKLPKRTKKIEDIPEKYRVLFTQDAGTGDWVRDDVESDDVGSGGGGERDRLGEFRENNIKLQREKAELLAQLKKYEGIDPEKVKKYEGEIAKIEADEERKLIQEGRFDDLFSRKTAAMRESWTKEKTALERALEGTKAENKNLRGTIGRYVIDNTLDEALSKVGKLKERARADARNRARSIFDVNEKGELTATRDGVTTYGDNGKELGIEEFAKKLLDDAPHFFEPSEGGGSGPGPKPNPGAGPGPRKSDTVPDDPLEFGKNLEGIAGRKTVAGRKEPAKQ